MTRLQSRDWLDERKAQLQQVLPRGRRWLFEVAWGRACFTSIKRHKAETSPIALYAIRFFPLSALQEIPEHAIAQAQPLVQSNFADLAGLTRRELEVFRLLGAGSSNLDVAKRIGRTTRLVESMTVRLRQRLGGATLRSVIARSACSGLHAIPERHWTEILTHRRSIQDAGSRYAVGCKSGADDAEERSDD